MYGPVDLPDRAGGRDAVYGYLGKLMEATCGSFDASILHVLANDAHSVVMQRSTATINGKDVSSTRSRHGSTSRTIRS